MGDDNSSGDDVDDKFVSDKKDDSFGDDGCNDDNEFIVEMIEDLSEEDDDDDALATEKNGWLDGCIVGLHLEPLELFCSKYKFRDFQAVRICKTLKNKN